MTHRPLKIFIILILGIALCYFCFIQGWYHFRRNTDTPRAFLNHAKISNGNYSKDSLEITHRLRKLLFNHEEFFDNTAYFEETNVLVDTLVYSPQFNKLAVLLTTQNPTSRQLAPFKDSEFYYDGTSYLGVGEADTISLSWLGPVFTNSNDKSKLSKDLRNACFKTFVSRDTTQEGINKYNFDDERFWTCSVWDEREAMLKRRKEFKEEKAKHPENVYEPRR